MPLRQLWPFGGPAIDATSLYAGVVAQARRPEFYARYSVPDTVDGRFDMIALHIFLVLHRLKALGASAAPLGQALFDTMFTDMDRSLREMGAGDLGVGRRVRAMAEGFYGRIAAYEQGLAAADATLADALRRNLFGTVAEPGPSQAALDGVCAYMRASVRLLADQSLELLAQGRVAFPEPLAESR